MKDVLTNIALLEEEMRLHSDVCYKCTHHGPSLNVPAMFAELGSSTKQWSDLKVARLLPRAVIKAIESFDESKAAPRAQAYKRRDSYLKYFQH